MYRGIKVFAHITELSILKTRIAVYLSILEEEIFLAETRRRKERKDNLTQRREDAKKGRNCLPASERQPPNPR